MSTIVIMCSAGLAISKNGSDRNDQGLFEPFPELGHRHDRQKYHRKQLNLEGNDRSSSQVGSIRTFQIST